MSRNLIVITALIAVSSAYLWASQFLTPVPDELMLVANLIAVPFVVGMFAGYLMVGRLAFKLLLLPFIPIAHVFIYGHDPAKPGIENLVALLEVLPLWVGCMLAHFLVRKRMRREKTQTRA